MAGERADAIPELADVIAWLEEQRAYCRPPHLADAPAEELDARRGPCAAYGATVYGLVLDKLRPLAAAAPLLPGGEEAERLLRRVAERWWPPVRAGHYTHFTYEKDDGALMDDLEAHFRRSARPDAERAPQEDEPRRWCAYCRRYPDAELHPAHKHVPSGPPEPRPQGDEVETVAQPQMTERWTVSNEDGTLVVRRPNGKPPWLTVGESVYVAPLDARSGADTVKLAEALKRIAYGLEYETRDDESRYDAPRDNTWWGRIALEALALPRPEADRPRDRLGGSPPSEPDDR